MMKHFQEARDALDRASVLEVVMVQVVVFRNKYRALPTLVRVHSSLRGAFCKELINQGLKTPDQSITNPLWLITDDGESVPLLFSQTLPDDTMLMVLHSGLKKETIL